MSNNLFVSIQWFFEKRKQEKRVKEVVSPKVSESTVRKAVIRENDARWAGRK